MKQVLLRLLNSYTVGFQTLIAQLIQGFQSYLINPEYSIIALDLPHAIYCVNHEEPLNSVVNMCDKSMKIIDITLPAGAIVIG